MVFDSTLPGYLLEAAVLLNLSAADKSEPRRDINQRLFSPVVCCL